METAPTTKNGAWIPERLTGLNEHVRYVHTKVLLIDMFSEEPIVISGSANFSRASMESNDENMLLVRGNKALADAYAVEFFRIFEHMRYRNKQEGTPPKGENPAATIADVALVLCHCGQAVAEREVKKPGRNTGRHFRFCANPSSRSCGFFVWVDDTPSPVEDQPWPKCCFQQSGFDAKEREMLGAFCSTACTSMASAPSIAATGDSENPEVFQSLDSAGMLEIMGAVEDEFHECVESPMQSVASSEDSGYRQSLDASSQHLLDASHAVQTSLVGARRLAETLSEVESNAKGGAARYRELRDQLLDTVHALPESLSQRGAVLQALDEMDKNFVAKTKSSWRPQLQSVLDLLCN